MRSLLSADGVAADGHDHFGAERAARDLSMRIEVLEAQLVRQHERVMCVHALSPR